MLIKQFQIGDDGQDAAQQRPRFLAGSHPEGGGGERACDDQVGGRAGQAWSSCGSGARA